MMRTFRKGVRPSLGFRARMPITSLWGAALSSLSLSNSTHLPAQSYRWPLSSAPSQGKTSSWQSEPYSVRKGLSLKIVHMKVIYKV